MAKRRKTKQTTNQVKAEQTPKIAQAPSKGIFTAEQAKTEHKHSPRLAKALRDVLDPSIPVTDFGCGKGDYIRHLKNHGYSVIGYEGTPELAEDGLIETKDVSVKMKSELFGNVLCLEVIEHIEKEREDVIITNLVEATRNGCRLIISWAIEGQGGCGHVNERDGNYVIPRIEKEGFEYSLTATRKLREEAGKDLWWFKKSVYVFDRIGQ